MSWFPNYWLLAVTAVALLVSLVQWYRCRHTRARRAAVRRLVLALLLVMIAGRPTVGSVSTTTYSAGVEVVIMIDRTTSMAAEDYAGERPRLEGVKADTRRLLTSVAGSRFSVVTFDNEAQTALPFTTDAAAVSSLVDAIGWREATYGTGSDIAVGIPEVRDLLERSRREHPEVGRYLVYVGDGEQTASSAPGSFASLQPLVDGGLVLGYGTAQGGPMKGYQDSDDYVTQNGSVVRPPIDQTNLRRIAEQLGVPYQHRTTGTALSLSVDRSVAVPAERREPRGFELYWILGLLAVGVLVIDLWDGVGRLRRARENVT